MAIGESVDWSKIQTKEGAVNTPIIWSPGVTLESIEKQVIMKAFSFFSKNKTATASALGIAVRTLDNKFEKYAEEEKAANEYVERERANRAYELARARGQVPTMPSNTPSGGPTNHIRHNGLAVSDAHPTVQNSGVQATPGDGMESVTHAPGQQPVSVPERQEIQGVLPRKSPPSYNGGRR